jgi:hypothetical protein
VEYFLFIYGSNSCVTAVVEYLASEEVVLGHGCDSISSEAFIRRGLILVFAHFGR